MRPELRRGALDRLDLDDVVAGVVVDLVEPAPGRYQVPIVAGAPVEYVAAFVAIEDVVAGVTEQHVLALVAP